MGGSPKIPAIYVAKYNRFVDNIIGSINRILGKSYDPVRVKLPSNEEKKNKSNPKTKKVKTTKKKKSSNRKRQAMRNKMGAVSIARATNKKEEMTIGRATESESREPSFILISKNGKIPVIRNVTVKIETIGTSKPAPKQNKKKIKKKQTNSITSSTSSSNKDKKKAAKKGQKAKATLFGLSSIKRDGDVQVHMMTDHTTVKTNFLLGPLTLRVEREFGKGGRRELKSATATTAEMYGRLNLRIIHGGAATLHSIRVLQPKQVRVDSAENHEKTKEFMWKRSSHIASVVSQKLASAARSMLKPPPTS